MLIFYSKNYTIQTILKETESFPYSHSEDEKFLKIALLPLTDIQSMSPCYWHLVFLTEREKN